MVAAEGGGGTGKVPGRGSSSSAVPSANEALADPAPLFASRCWGQVTIRKAHKTQSFPFLSAYRKTAKIKTLTFVSVHGQIAVVLIRQLSFVYCALVKADAVPAGRNAGRQYPGSIFRQQQLDAFVVQLVYRCRTL
uniref:Uncharacterized protein n=1 Tax=Anopheles farauti TaxID=69004 RepID=A0A182QFB1_9DIPT